MENTSNDEHTSRLLILRFVVVICIIVVTTLVTFNNDLVRFTGE